MLEVLCSQVDTQGLRKETRSFVSAVTLKYQHHVAKRSVMQEVEVLTPGAETRVCLR